MLGPGEVWGFDAAGVVAAADGSGPPVGTRVVTVLPGPGALARRMAVGSADVAILPDGVDAGTATALALPGASALQAVGVLGTLLGLRLPVTGASGTVGWYAVQLAARAGMYVVAAVRSPGDSDALAEIGADETVTDLGQVESPVDAVLDVVGGPALVRAFDLLTDGGTALAVGAVSGEPATFAPETIVGPQWRRIEGFRGRWPVGRDLDVLLDLLVAGRLRPQASWHGGWQEIDGVANSLSTGVIRRRAILELR